MKKLLRLFITTCVGIGTIIMSTSVTHANVDSAIVTNVAYTCDKATGIGRLVYNTSEGLSAPQVWNNVNHAGYIEITTQYSNLNITRARNIYIPGCGCPEAVRGGVVSSYPIGELNSQLTVYVDGDGVPLSCSGKNESNPICIDQNALPECALSIDQSTYLVREKNPTAQIVKIKSNQGANVGLTGTYNCRMPEGTPTVTCGATSIPVTNSTFTLPASVMGQVGKCVVTFGGENSCYGGGYATTIEIRDRTVINPVTPTNPNDPDNSNLCFIVQDGYHIPYTGNLDILTLKFQNGTTRTVQVTNTGNGRYCSLTPLTDLTPGTPYEIVDPFPFVDPTSNPGGSIISGGGEPTSNPGGYKISKPCVAHLEVQLGEGDAGWSTDGVLYDELLTYRIVVEKAGTHEPCTPTSTLTMIPSQISVIGGTLSGSISPLSSTGTFTAYIQKSEDALPDTPRGLSVVALYNGYKINENPDNFIDPMKIMGDVTKGVRVIGATSGTGDSKYNQNADSLILADSSSIVVTARNALYARVAELTRNVKSGSSTDTIVYSEGDTKLSSVKGLLTSPKTLIVRGGNLTIDANLPNSSDGYGIIVLRDNNGKGGDIVVENNVTEIKARIYADGTFYGDQGNTQLVLIGSLFSVNTIGGSANVNDLFLAGNVKVDKTKLNEAKKQDLNNVRKSSGGKSYKNLRDPFIIDSTVHFTVPGFES